MYPGFFAPRVEIDRREETLGFLNSLSVTFQLLCAGFVYVSEVLNVLDLRCLSVYHDFGLKLTLSRGIVRILGQVWHV